MIFLAQIKPHLIAISLQETLKTVRNSSYQKAVYVDTVSDENDAAVYSTSVMCYDGNYYKLTAPAGSRPFEHKIILKEGKTKVII